MHDATAGRVLDRLDAFGTLRLFTAWAVWAATRVGLERRSGPCATPARRGGGDDPDAAPQELPWQEPSGYSQEKRPDLHQGVLSTRCLARAGPMWGQPADGQASAKTLKTTLWSEIAPRLAPYGGQPGASRALADVALVPADHLAARRAPWFLPR